MVLALVAILLLLPLTTSNLATAAGNSPPPCYQWSPRTNFADLSAGIAPGNTQYPLYFFVNFDYFQGHVYFTSSGAPSSISIGLVPSSLYVPAGSSFTETLVTLSISTPPSYVGSFNLTLNMTSPDGYSEGNICSFSTSMTVPVLVGTAETLVTFETEKGFTGLTADNKSNLTIYVKTSDGNTGEAVPFFEVSISSLDKLVAAPNSDDTLQLLKPSVETTNQLTVVTNGTGVARIIVGPWDTPLLNPIKGSWFYEQVQISATWKPSSTDDLATTTYSLRVYQPPVLLVHGTCSSSATWTSPGDRSFPGTIARINFLQTLQSQGLRVSTMNYDSGANNKGDITVEWTKVQSSLNNMQADLAAIGVKAEQFDVVAHSAGGLVVRYYTQQDPNEKVNKLIFLGSTNNGFYEWSEVLYNDRFYAKSLASIFGDNFLQCLSGDAAVIKQQNPVDPVGVRFLASLNTWHGTGLNPQVRYFAVLGTTSMAFRGGGDDDGLVKHSSTTLGGKVSSAHYVQANHVDLTGSQDVVNVVVPLLLGNSVPSQYSEPIQISTVKALMSAMAGEVRIRAAGFADQVLAKGYQIVVGVGKLLDLPVGSSATISLSNNQQFGELLVGSQSRDTVIELGGVSLDRVNVILYSGTIGVIVDEPGATAVSVIVPNLLTEVADDAAAFSVSVGDNGSYTVTVLQGNVSLRHPNGSNALTLGPSSQVNIDSKGIASAVQKIVSNWPEEAALTDYFKAQGLTIPCKVFLNLTQCPQAGQYTPTVRAFNNQTQLTYFGQAVSCSDLQSQNAGEMFQVLSSRVMTDGNSNGQQVPLIIASPSSCSDQLNLVINNVGLANRSNVWYLISGKLNKPTLVTKALALTTSSTTALSTTTSVSATTSATTVTTTAAATTVTSTVSGSAATTTITSAVTETTGLPSEVTYAAVAIAIITIIAAAALTKRKKQ